MKLCSLFIYLHSPPIQRPYLQKPYDAFNKLSYNVLQTKIKENLVATVRVDAKTECGFTQVNTQNQTKNNQAVSTHRDKNKCSSTYDLYVVG